MKTITIYTRNVLERTGYRKHPYKEAMQYIVTYDGKIFKNHDQSLDNPRLKVQFEKVLETRSKKELDKFISHLGKSYDDQDLKYDLNNVIKLINN